MIKVAIEQLVRGWMETIVQLAERIDGWPKPRAIHVCLALFLSLSLSLSVSHDFLCSLRTLFSVPFSSVRLRLWRLSNRTHQKNHGFRVQDPPLVVLPRFLDAAFERVRFRRNRGGDICRPVTAGWALVGRDSATGSCVRFIPIWL